MKLYLNSKGNAMVAVLGITILLNATFALVYYSTNSSVKTSGVRKARASTLNIAEAGKEHLYSQIRAGIYMPKKDSNQAVFSNYDFDKGKYSVTCSAKTVVDTLYIVSRGIKDQSETTLDIIAVIQNAINFGFPPARGAVTARSNVNVLGNIEIDGRDYDSSANGTIIGNGVFGVSTCMTLDVDGSSMVGGNGQQPVDKQAINAVMNTVAEQNVPVTGVFASPEAFLGLPAGSLDRYKVTTMPQAPFHGIYYLPINFVGPVHFGEFSSGILIVHNTARTATLKLEEGTFKGIIITDLMDKINGSAKVYGTIATLCESEVATFGNGNAKIRYSSQILANIGRYCNNLPKTVNEVSWKER